MKFIKKPRKLMTRTSARGSESINIGDQICNNDFYISSQFKSTKVKKVQDIWYFKYTTDNTFKSYLYGLQPISYLCNAYEETKDKKYLFKAKEILLDYLDFISKAEDPRSDREFVISTRSITIIYLLSLSLDNEIFSDDELKKTEELLVYNSEYLKDSSHYLFSNHGMWQDLALLTIALLEIENINKDEIIEVALYRINRQITKNFTEEYINIENSFFYHKYNLYLIEKINEFIQREVKLSDKQKLLIVDIDSLAINGNKVFGEFIKPNNTCTLIGDTEEKVYKEYAYNPNNAIFPKTGLVFLKGENYFLNVKSGVQGRGHKHFDDLSFNYFYDGMDIFIDCGKYTYEVTNPITTTMWSVFGHNTLIFNNDSYKINNKSIYLTPENISKSGIEKYEITDKYEYVRLFNNFYDGVELRREYIFIKPNNIIILDNYKNIKDKSEDTLTQNYVLNERLKVIRKNKEKCILRNKERAIIVEINQLLPIKELEYNRKNHKNYRGFSSKKFNVLDGAHNLAFTKKPVSGQVQFITSINVMSENTKDRKIDSIDLTEQILSIRNGKENIMFDIEKSEFIKSNIEIEAIYANNVISILVKNNIGKVACYVKIDNNIEYKQKYQKSNRFKFDNINGKKIEIKVYEKIGSTVDIKKIEINL